MLCCDTLSHGAACVMLTQGAETLCHTQTIMKESLSNSLARSYPLGKRSHWERARGELFFTCIRRRD